MRRTGWFVAVCAGVLAVAVGCGGDAGPGGGDDAAPPADAGLTPAGTLAAYYYYKDRGNNGKLRELVRSESLSEVSKEDGLGAPAGERRLRGMVIDHESARGNVVTLYHRTWATEEAKEKGGRPVIAILVREEDMWKMDLFATLRETFAITKGRTRAGFYDGSKNWWR